MASDGGPSGNTTPAAMSLQRFAELAAAWGADVTRWPSGEQPAAVRVLASAAGYQGRELLAEAELLDRWMDAAPVPPPSAALHDAVLARAPTASAAPAFLGSRPWHALGGLRIAGPAFAAALVMGVALAEVREPASSRGQASAATAAVDPAEDLLSAALLHGGDEELL